MQIRGIIKSIPSNVTAKFGIYRKYVWYFLEEPKTTNAAVPITTEAETVTNTDAEQPENQTTSIGIAVKLSLSLLLFAISVFLMAQ